MCKGSEWEDLRPPRAEGKALGQWKAVKLGWGMGTWLQRSLDRYAGGPGLHAKHDREPAASVQAGKKRTPLAM